VKTRALVPRSGSSRTPPKNGRAKRTKILAETLGLQKGRRGNVGRRHAEQRTHDHAQQPEPVCHGEHAAAQRAAHRRGGSQRVFQKPRPAAPHEHGAGPEPTPAERGEIEMPARRGIRIEQHLESPVENEAVPRAVGHHPAAGPVRGFQQDKRSPRPGQHLRARQPRQPRANNNRHDLVNTSAPRFEQIFLAPDMLPLSLIFSSCTRSHL
jgi:hypothetical protein